MNLPMRITRRELTADGELMLTVVMDPSVARQNGIAGWRDIGISVEPPVTISFPGLVPLPEPMTHYLR